MKQKLSQVEIFRLLRTVAHNQSPRGTVDALDLLCLSDMENELRLRKLLDKMIMHADERSAKKNFAFLAPVLIFAHGYDGVDSDVCSLITDHVRTAY